VYIGVVGAAQCSDRLAETAAAVGQEVARRGGVVVGGGFGTLSEIASALKLGVPVVGLDSWGFSPPVEAPPLAEGAYARAGSCNLGRRPPIENRSHGPPPSSRRAVHNPRRDSDSL
jgi:predicted Rossmann-fold nucleotide-binding protein